MAVRIEKKIKGYAVVTPEDKAKDTVRASATYVGERATTALKRSMAHDPLRAMLIAAGTGAVLMAVATMLAWRVRRV